MGLLCYARVALDFWYTDGEKKLFRLKLLGAFNKLRDQKNSHFSPQIDFVDTQQMKSFYALTYPNGYHVIFEYRLMSNYHSLTKKAQESLSLGIRSNLISKSKYFFDEMFLQSQLENLCRLKRSIMSAWISGEIEIIVHKMLM